MCEQSRNATSYHINMAACREANEMLTKENRELRTKLAEMISSLRDQVAGIGRADYPPTQAQIKAAQKIIANRLGYEESSAKAWLIAQAALAAAAAAGLPTTDDVKGILRDDWLHPATIERCAQVAERFAEGGACASAIRALKDRHDKN